jgi:DNA-binding protein HU-beta
VTYREIVDWLADSASETKKLSDDFIKELVDIINTGLEREGKVRISNFGTFELRSVAERTGRNPQTGEEIVIPAHNKVGFKPSSRLEAHVNRKFNDLEPQPVEEPVKPETTPPPPVEEPVKPETTPPPPLPPGKSERKNKVPLYALVGIVLIFIIIAAFFLWNRNNAVSPEMAETKHPVETINQPPAEQPGNIPTETQQEQTKIPEQQEQQEQQPDQAKLTAKTETNSKAGGTRRVRRGDNLWLLADQYYQNPYFWPNIYRVNLSKIENPNLIIAGRQIEIPAFEGVPENLTRTDSTNLAKGYFEVYKYFSGRKSIRAKYYLWATHSFNPVVIHDNRAEIADSDLDFLP